MAKHTSYCYECLTYFPCDVTGCQGNSCRSLCPKCRVAAMAKAK